MEFFILLTSFQHFTNKHTRGPLQQFLSSDLVGSVDEVKSPQK